MNSNTPYVPVTFGEHPNNPFFVPQPRPPRPLDVDKTKKPIVVAKKSNK